jgi:uncharacterized protein (DUF1015 family)
VPRVSPFQSLVFDTAIAGPLDLVTAPPYDAISDGGRRAYLEGSPFSIVHLDLSEGSKRPADPDSRYAHAARVLTDWEMRGAVKRSAHPGYFAYEMAFSLEGTERRIRGILCAVELEGWGGDVIPHERTLPGPVHDRLELLRATRTHLSPVYGTIDGPNPALSDLLRATAEEPAPFETLDEQGVRHRMWPVSRDTPITEWLAHRPMLIADGHHRYTTALAYRNERHAAEGPGSWDRVLTLVVDDDSQDLPVFPFHRIQRAGKISPMGSAVSGLDAALAQVSDRHVRVAMAAVENGSVRYRVVTLTGGPPAVRALHASVLDVEGRSGSLRFTPDAQAAADAVAAGEAVAAWFLPPTTAAEIRAVVERGERLPEKSTYFWPKPRTGMVMMPLDPA